MSELIQIQRDGAYEALAEEREKYGELEKICRAQHEAINQCADHLHEAHLALLGFIDVKMDIYTESRKRAKARKSKLNKSRFNMSTEELALKHGAIIENAGEFDERYLMTKDDLCGLICDIRINARISERDWLRLLIKKLLKEIE